MWSYYGYDATVATTLSKPENDKAWMDLCRDPRWNYKAPDPSQDLHFTIDWESAGFDELDERKNKIITAPLSTNPSMHPGSVAPKFVFEQAENEPSNDDMMVYRKRLICFLCGRFVVIPRPCQGTYLVQSQGLPRDGERHWWRYWDNEGNVFQFRFEKYRDEPDTLYIPHSSGSAVEQGMPIYEFRRLDEEGLAPGDFSSGARTGTTLATVPWMRIPAHHTSTRKEYSNLSQLAEYLWSFVHRGTTRYALWDACLLHLSRLAGVPAKSKCERSCSTDAKDLARCSQCKLVFYCKNGECQKIDWPRHKKICKYFKVTKHQGCKTV